MAKKTDFVVSTATFSPCRTWRYALCRKWEGWLITFPDPWKMCAFIGLNPSKANENDSDPTVTRCINFAKKWGYDGLFMLNLFGIAETDAKLAMSHPERVGPETDSHLLDYLKCSDLVIAAWGAQKGIEDRIAEVIELASKAGKDLHCLKKTKDGHPWHPLYVKADTHPQLWRSCDVNRSTNRA